MLDQIISESYQNFLSTKSRCESIQSVSNLRWKRSINDQNLIPDFIYFFGASSGYGSESSSGYGSDCCPPVVDPLTFTALLGFIGAATYFLQFTITMLLAKRRRKRSLKSGRPEHAFDYINLGTKIIVFAS